MIPIGKNAPKVFNVVVEIPKGSRNKYEVDKETNAVFLDRVLRSSVVYPGDYGYVPETLYSDGDPLDVLIINRFPTFPGCIVEVRPIGVLEMVDTGEDDEKIIAVPTADIYFDSWKDITSVPEPLRNEIEEFFKTYKTLEKNKWVKTKGFKGKSHATQIVKSSVVKQGSKLNKGK